MLTNPTVIDIPVNVWTKVASSVVAGQIHKLIEAPQEYRSTYRVAGDPQPIDSEAGRLEGVNLFPNGEKSAAISFTDSADIYVYAIGVAGKVRVDL